MLQNVHERVVESVVVKPKQFDLHELCSCILTRNIKSGFLISTIERTVYQVGQSKPVWDALMKIDPQNGPKIDYGYRNNSLKGVIIIYDC